MCVVVKVHQQIPGHLRHPRTGRVRGDPGQVHPTSVEFNDEQHIQPGQALDNSSTDIADELAAAGVASHRLRHIRAASPRGASAVAGPGRA
jgi:hypothetical protein